MYRCPFTEPPIRDYLEDFYSPQGKVQFEYLEGATYFLNECETCGLIFQKEVPNDVLMGILYETWIDPEKAFLSHQEQNGLHRCSSYAQEIMQIIAYLGKKPSSLYVLDFGMGWGQWAIMAKAFGCNSYGSELSEERRRCAQAGGIVVLSWDEIPQHQFDFINTEQVFEHLPDPLGTLMHLAKAVGPGGVLKISVPTANDIARRLRIMDWRAPRGTRNSLNAVAPLEHINCFRRKSLIKMAALAGMGEVFVPLLRQYQFATDWSGAMRIAKNVLLPIYRNVLRRQNYLLFRNVE